MQAEPPATLEQVVEVERAVPCGEGAVVPEEGVVVVRGAEVLQRMRPDDPALGGWLSLEGQPAVEFGRSAEA